MPNSLKLESKILIDNKMSLEKIKEQLKEKESIRPFAFSIESTIENEYWDYTKKTKQETKIDLSIDEAKSLRDALDEMIHYLEGEKLN